MASSRENDWAIAAVLECYWKHYPDLTEDNFREKLSNSPYNIMEIERIAAITVRHATAEIARLRSLNLEFAEALSVRSELEESNGEISR